MDRNLADFIESPVMQIVGTSGPSRQPEVARAAGAWSENSNSLHLVVSAWQWPQTITNLRDNGRIAVTFARPSDYVSYQIKGVATLRAASGAERERSSRYVAAMISVLMKLGVMPEMASPWFTNKDPVLVAVEVASVFVQTPGARAGTRL